MTASSYIDTSALAKWYLNEARSDDFEAFIQQQRSAAISRLTVLEFRCLLARRRRSRDISGQMENRVFATFENDIRNGFLTVYALEDGHALAAIEILAHLKTHPLRSLDALHLAIVRNLGMSKIATADRMLADAANALGIATVRFD